MVEKAKDELETMDFKTFLETVAPGGRAKVSGLRVAHSYSLRTPDLLLYCSWNSCRGIRTFESSDRRAATNDGGEFFLIYQCRNCRRRSKTYALLCSFESLDGVVLKLGEEPMFGDPIPARVVTLVGGDRDLFLKGNRCEKQGLGIGAFTYYRRVIEDQKNRIFDEIVRVLQSVDPDSQVIEELVSAKTETHFSKSVDKIKHALPASIQINGQNPLRLLHGALSQGVHSMSDADCLEYATAVRTVLIEFSERLAAALNNDAELAKSISLLGAVKGGKPLAKAD